MPWYVAQAITTTLRPAGTLGPSDLGHFDVQPEGIAGISFVAPDWWWGVELSRMGIPRYLVFSTVPLTGPTLLSAVEDDPLTAARRTLLANRFPALDFSSDVTVKDALKRILLPFVTPDASGVREIVFGNRVIYRGQ